MDISHNIKRRRLELGISQQALAETLGYKSRSAIAKIENGTNDIPLSKLVVLAKALDTNIESLLSGSGTQSSISPEVDKRNRSTNSTKNVAVILAGGKSSRNMQNVPNQFISVAGKPVITYCLEVYQKHPLVDDIFIVCLEDWKTILAAYTREYRLSKVRGLVPAGKSGIQSIRNAVMILREQGYSGLDIVIFQESTRPFVTENIVSKLLLSCQKNGSAITCEPMNDKVQFIIEDGHAKYVDREKVVDLQSPDAHTFESLEALFDKANRSGHKLTENCVGLLMANLGMDLRFCEGPHNNIKIIRQEDVAVFSALLKTNSI